MAPKKKKRLPVHRSVPMKVTQNPKVGQVKGSTPKPRPITPCCR